MKLQTSAALLIALLLAAPAMALNRQSLDALLDTLDGYVANQATFDRVAQERIAGRLRTLQSLPAGDAARRTELLSELGDAYARTNIDSAFSYYRRAERQAVLSGDSSATWRQRLKLCRIYPLKGLVHTAITKFNSINRDALPADVMLDFYDTGRQIYVLGAQVIEGTEYYRYYLDHADRLLDSAIMHLPADGRHLQYYRSMRNLHGPNGAEAAAQLTELLQRIPKDDPNYARIAAEIGGYYASEAGNTEQAKYFLALSAISDIMTGNAETTSLHRLAIMLSHDGDDERAYRYLTHSLTRAVHSGARIRSLEIAEALPVVLNTAAERERSNRRLMWIVIGLLSALTLTLVVLAWHFYRHRQRLARMQVELSKTNDLKDEYIRQVLSLCGVYISELDNFSRFVSRKLKAKQYADLLTHIESGKAMRNQVQTFYEVFDRAFTMVYPTFLTEVTRLFRDGEGPAIPADGSLTTELRLLAFMRLGIDDGQEIAKFLGVSINTVYTYRNKFKSHAVDRDHFDEDIRTGGRREAPKSPAEHPAKAPAKAQENAAIAPEKPAESAGKA